MDGSGPEIHPSVLREIHYVGGECENRHRRTNEAVLTLSKRQDRADAKIAANRERIVELCGVNGDNGKIEALREEVSLMRGKVDSLMLRTAGGALAGGGLVAGLIEALRALLGG